MTSNAYPVIGRSASGSLPMSSFQGEVVTILIGSRSAEPSGRVSDPAYAAGQSVRRNPYHGALGRPLGRAHHPMKGCSCHHVMTT